MYESVKPPSGNSKLLWHALGAKTLELIHENIHVEGVRDDLETLVMDADVLASLAPTDASQQARRIEFKLIARLRRHEENPVFVALGLRLEELRERHEQGLLSSLYFLKELLALARDVVEAEKEANPQQEQNQAKAALTELFSEVRSATTPVMVERIVDDIDSIVRIVGFPGWQQTIAGEREVKYALRRTLLKYKLHHEQDLFDRAYVHRAILLESRNASIPLTRL
jgi:type I restriction enzyme R subunit